ncbi:MAG: 2-C-methyl-D-erythritol 4-phosphate cytidylyltransferase [Coriobacteriia bacterium]|nr:2-C-methyl-D-erythritol 4-phosphate cytidylyltransferase [Coriobacteriia bacterium]
MLGNVAVTAIVAAGGNGSRLEMAGGKQMLALAGRPLLAWTVEAVAATSCVDEIVVVCDPARVDEYERAVCDEIDIEAYEVSLRFVAGGATRSESVRCGLDVVTARDGLVAIHDGARPFIAPETVQAACKKLFSAGVDGVAVGYPMVDTMKRVDGEVVCETPDRSRYWAVQTPQIFRFERLLAAYEHAVARNIDATDDAALVEADGGTVIMFEGPRDNIKITRSEDVTIAEAILERKTRENGETGTA